MISKLKSNVQTLEEQINSLKSDLLEVRVTSSHRHRSASRTPNNKKSDIAGRTQAANRQSTTADQDGVWYNEKEKSDSPQEAQFDINSGNAGKASPVKVSTEIQTADNGFSLDIRCLTNTQQQQTSFTLDSGRQTSPMRRSNEVQKPFMSNGTRQATGQNSAAQTSFIIADDFNDASPTKMSSSVQTSFYVDDRPRRISSSRMINVEVQTSAAADDGKVVRPRADDADVQTSFILDEEKQRSTAHRVSVATTMYRSKSRSRSPSGRESGLMSDRNLNHSSSGRVSSKSPRRCYVEVETETLFGIDSTRSDGVINGRKCDVKVSTSVSSKKLNGCGDRDWQKLRNSYSGLFKSDYLFVKLLSFVFFYPLNSVEINKYSSSKFLIALLIVDNQLYFRILSLITRL